MRRWRPDRVRLALLLLNGVNRRTGEDAVSRSARASYALILLTAATGVAEGVCVPPATTRDPLVAYVTSYIESLSYADSAVQRGTASANVDGVAIAVTIQVMTNLELVARDYECAASVFGRSTANPFPATPDKLGREHRDLAAQNADTAQLAYLALAQKNRDRANLLQSVLNGSRRAEDLPQLVANISADTTELLGMLVTVSTIVTHLLVDPTPGPAGRMDNVRITRKHRDDLLNLITARFGSRAAKFAAGTPYVEAAAALLRQFLTQPGWRYKAERPSQ